MKISYQNAINEAREKLIANQIYDGFAFRYMLELCQLHDINLYIDKDLEMSNDIANQYSNGINRLLKNEPLAYVLGFEWFYGRRFIVNEDVLIPRQETEELLGNTLALIDEHFNQGGIIADIATGSGNLAVSLSLETDDFEVFGLDISDKALNIAQLNAQKLEAKVKFLCGDMAQPLIDNNIRVDVLVANPPYIASSEVIQSSVYDYEPHLALFGGIEGLDLYFKLFDQLPYVLKEKAIVGMEIGYLQKEILLPEIKKRFINAKCWCQKDINGLDRMLFISFGI